jgi:hypothetical protein
MNPLPRNLGELLTQLQARHRPRDEQRHAREGAARRVPGRRQGPHKIAGQPFKIAEIEAEIRKQLNVPEAN